MPGSSPSPSPTDPHPAPGSGGRGTLGEAARIVVKLGTGILTGPDNLPRLAQMDSLVEQMAALHHEGRELVLVSSGAVGAGMGILGLERRPPALPQLQACAAVGQPRLITTYQRLFAKERIVTAQVLLTHEDLEDHDRHLNARSTLTTLLSRRIVPIVNENDAVSLTELRFGDNDRLSALVASLLPADLLVILTTAEGLIEGYGTPEARRIGTVETIDRHIESLARGTSSPTATGGMISKVRAARITRRSGIPTLIASGRQPRILRQLLDGNDEGTLFLPHPSRLRGRKRWIAFFHHPQGGLVVDDGAKVALRENGRSLLTRGIVRVEGDFSRSEVISLLDLDGAEFGRGIAAMDSEDYARKPPAEKLAIHRNHLVIL